MNRSLLKPRLILSIVVLMFLSSCTESNKTEKLTDTQAVQTSTAKITSLDDLNALFDKLQYSEKSLHTADQSIPRITFESVGEKWVNDSPQLPVNTKKSIFFRLMTPLILVSNENILLQREIVINEQLDSQKLIDIALQYKVITDESATLTEEHRQNLLSRVDIVPVSLALAQAAEESGWATSRFALEGNAFFGQWDFSGNGMKPNQHREHLGNYGVARFDSPLASVEAYMLNLNTNPAYQNLRSLRSTIRDKNQLITGYELAGTLDKYSERGEDYINGIRHLITFNKLQPIDSATLSKDNIIHLISGNK